MKVVNLSRRPFVNRRPVVRVAAGLWILGGLLLLANFWLYGSHFSGSSKGQGRLQSLNRQVQQEEDRLAELWKELKGLDLGARNRKARYLNSLIHTRTFPWSALFDDLEKVLPIDVYLGSVQPALSLAKQPKIGASASPRRAITAREARARARGELPDEDSQEEEEEEENESLFSGDRVSLTLRGYARNDEALFELVDRLYQSRSFRDPDLSRESKDKSGKVSFNLKVVYLTPKKDAPPPEEGDPGAEQAIASAGSPRSTSDTRHRNGPELVTVIEEPGSEPEGQASTLRPTGSRGISDRQAGASNERRGRRSRDVRRAEPQAKVDFPPEEGEGEPGIESATRRRNRRSGGSRSVTRPSTVSVAPGATPSSSSIEDARAREEAEKEARARARARRRSQTLVPTLPQNTSGSTRPGTQPSSTKSGSTTPPIPTQPAASSSPKLQGSLFDRWIPDFLLWTPEFTEPAVGTEEVVG